MKTVLTSLIFFTVCLALHAQSCEIKAVQTKYVSSNTSDSIVKLFSNSEIEGVTFLVSSDLKENTLFIKTNYSGIYNVRFVDYFGHSSIEFPNVNADIVIDLEDFDRNIFIMNISDENNKKLISSQIINLKRKIY